MCVVPTLTFDLLFAFLVLGHGRRQLLWFEVTRHPTAEWLARQITEAFPWTSAPAYLVRDNDGACGHVFTCPFRKLYPDVLMMQSGQDRNGDNDTGPLDCSMQGRIFL